MAVQSNVHDYSGAITTGDTAQSALTQNFGRQYLFIQNIDAAEDLWFRIGGTAAIATQGSVKLVAGASYTIDHDFIPNDAVSIIAHTTGHKFTIYEG